MKLALIAISALALTGCGTTQATVGAGRMVAEGVKADLEAAKGLAEGFKGAFEPAPPPAPAPDLGPHKIYSAVPQTEK